MPQNESERISQLLDAAMNGVDYRNYEAKRAEAKALVAQMLKEARADERTLCFDNIGSEDIKVRAWVAKRKAALSNQKESGDE